MTSVDPLTFLPAFAETMARIRARMDGDANAGLALTDPAYTDTREGSFYWDMTQVSGLEMARLWDAIGSETIAAAFPATAWGEYLDNHGLTFNLVRNAAVAATGIELFVGASNTLVAAGTEVSTQPSDPNADPITFATTIAGTTCAQILGPIAAATPSTTGGTLTAGTYYYHVTAYNAYGESLRGNEVAAIITGTTGSVTLTWPSVAGATAYRVYRTLIAGTLGSMIIDTGGGTPPASIMDTNSVAPSTLEPQSNTTGGVFIPIVAQDAGSAGNLGVLALDQIATVVSGITSAMNPAATSGGTDVEDDDAFRLRILGQYQGQGAGTTSDYVTWALDYVGVERAVCIPIWNGPGTVLVIPMLSDGSPVAANVVTGLQAQLDPNPGLGHGQAPIGATVTVSTTQSLTVNIAGTMTFVEGFTLDGASGTIATRAAITAQLAAYLTTLNPGDTIVYQQVQAAFFQTPGLIRVNNLTVNGGSADVVLSLNPPQTPSMATPTLS